MSTVVLPKNYIQPIKQLLNFVPVERKCEPFDISKFYKVVLLLNGNDTSRLINLQMFIDSENRKEIERFIKSKNQESAIRKRLKMALNSILTRKRDNDFYEIEYKTENARIGVFKFHKQQNTRLICREYSKIGRTIIMMIETLKKKGQRNTDDAKYNNGLIAASKINYYNY